MAKYELTKDKFLTHDEYLALQTTLRRYRESQLRDVTMIDMFLHTAARAVEVLAITKYDIDPSNKSVYIRAVKNSRDRTIPLTKDLFERLVELSSQTDNFLFDVTYNRALDIWKMYRPCNKGLHALRHTAAVLFYRKTKDVKLLQTYLGHRYLSNTMIYVEFNASFDELRWALVPDDEIEKGHAGGDEDCKTD